MNRREFFALPAAFLPAGRVKSGPEESLESRILELTNEARAGLRPLEPHPGLRAAARRHSLDMSRRGFFDHRNPEGLRAQERVNAMDRAFVGVVGENIWMWRNGNPPPVEELARKIVQGWMDSPGHRRNILSTEFTHLGAGVYLGGGAVHAAQNFGRVDGYLESPLPVHLPPGGTMTLGVRPGARSHGPTAAEIRSASGAQPVAGPLPVDRPFAMPALPGGVYRLVFWFDAGNEMTGAFGPVFQIRGSIFSGLFSQMGRPDPLTV